MNKSPGISKGILKRIAIARALVNDGKYVFFDEPTEGLDAKGEKAVHHLLKELAKMDKTLIVGTNNEDIIRAAQIIIDLSEKPVPLVVHQHGKNREG